MGQEDLAEFSGQKPSLFHGKNGCLAGNAGHNTNRRHALLLTALIQLWYGVDLVAMRQPHHYKPLLY
jgi:hypothetical protein